MYSDGQRVDLILLQRGVGGSEVHRLRGELLDPPAGSDRLVVDLGPGLHALEVLEPLLVDGVGERRSGPREGDPVEGGSSGRSSVVTAAVVVVATRGTEQRQGEHACDDARSRPRIAHVFRPSS